MIERRFFFVGPLEGCVLQRVRRNPIQRLLQGLSVRSDVAEQVGCALHVRNRLCPFFFLEKKKGGGERGRRRGRSTYACKNIARTHKLKQIKAHGISKVKEAREEKGKKKTEMKK